MVAANTALDTKLAAPTDSSASTSAMLVDQGETIDQPSQVFSLRGAGRTFGSHAALSDISFQATQGERIALLGPSGAGKSTLLSLLNASVRATSGSVNILGRNVEELTPKTRRELQRRIGTISQRLDLIEQVRVLHNVNVGRLSQWSTPRALGALLTRRPDKVVLDALRRVGMEWAVHERTEKLSGGERQRVAIARTLVHNPELVLADEPVSSLDPRRASEVLEMLSLWGAEVTTVVSLHQPDLARRHCTRAIGLRDGHMVFDLPAAEITDALLAALYAES